MASCYGRNRRNQLLTRELAHTRSSITRSARETRGFPRAREKGGGRRRARNGCRARSSRCKSRATFVQSWMSQLPETSAVIMALTNATVSSGRRRVARCRKLYDRRANRSSLAEDARGSPVHTHNAPRVKTRRRGEERRRKEGRKRAREDERANYYDLGAIPGFPR